MGLTTTIDDIKKRCTEDSNGCWNWHGATASGYGRFKKNGVLYSAHRVVYAITNPDVEIKSLDVCHKCDNRLCCNPDHLFAGTRSDNMMDCSRKGRLAAQNGLHVQPKYGPEYIHQIKELKRQGISKCKIAKMLGWAPACFQRYEKRHGI